MIIENSKINPVNELTTLITLIDASSYMLLYVSCVYTDQLGLVVYQRNFIADSSSAMLVH